MRKPLKIALSTIGVIMALPVLLLTTTSVVNLVATKADLAAITSYGTLVPVDGKQMNVLMSGHGEQTIVLLPGLGTAAPALDFQPLVNELEGSYRVVTIEPFGTGLSDQTDKERTVNNIAREVHEALQYLGVDRYILMGHSIAGIYALEYSAAYADEITAFVGIDSSVPDQPGWDEAIPTAEIVALRDLGITRALSGIASDPYAGLPYSAQAKEQMKLLSTKNAAAPTLINEMERTPSNFAKVSGATFPHDLPVLLFVRTKNPDVPGWLPLHERQAASVANGRVVALEGDHYLHHTLAPEITRHTATFLKSLSLR